MRRRSGTGRKRSRGGRGSDSGRYTPGLRSTAMTFCRIDRRDRFGSWSGIFVDPLNDLAIDSRSHHISDCSFSMLVEAGVSCMNGRTVVNGMVVCTILVSVRNFFIRTLGHTRAWDVHSKFLEPGRTADMDRQLWNPQSASVLGAAAGFRYVPPRSRALRTRCSCVSVSRIARSQHSSWSPYCRSQCRGSWYS